MQKVMNSVVPLIARLQRRSRDCQQRWKCERNANRSFLPKENFLTEIGWCGRDVSVSQNEAAAAATLLVNCGDLMWKRIDQGGMNGEDRIKKVRESNPLCFGHQSKKRTVPIKAPRPAESDDFKTGFIMAIKELVPNAARSVFVCEFERLRAEPLRVDRADK